MHTLKRRQHSITRLGMGKPEAQPLRMGQAYATAAKSNAGYKAYNTARDFVRRTGSQAVPLHLRNAPTKLMKEMGYGQEYRYAHDEPNAYAAGEQYFPQEMAQTRYYHPTNRGLEGKIGEKLAWLAGQDQNSPIKRYR